MSQHCHFTPTYMRNQKLRTCCAQLFGIVVSLIFQNRSRIFLQRILHKFTIYRGFAINAAQGMGGFLCIPILKQRSLPLAIVRWQNWWTFILSSKSFFWRHNTMAFHFMERIFLQPLDMCNAGKWFFLLLPAFLSISVVWLFNYRHVRSILITATQTGERDYANTKQQKCQGSLLCCVLCAVLVNI